MPVFFQCKNCGKDHVSPLFFPDEKSFRIGPMGVMTFPCPVTAKTAPYEKKHMYWVREEKRAAYPLRQHAQT